MWHVDNICTCFLFVLSLRLGPTCWMNGVGSMITSKPLGSAPELGVSPRAVRLACDGTWVPMWSARRSTIAGTAKVGEVHASDGIVAFGMIDPDAMGMLSRAIDTGPLLEDPAGIRTWHVPVARCTMAADRLALAMSMQQLLDNNTSLDLECYRHWSIVRAQ